jgi:hypothetical protein
LSPSRSLLAAFFLALWGCGPNQPANPLELQLNLGKNRIEAGEYLWYLLEVRNVGFKPVSLYEHFWFTQQSLRTHWIESAEIRLEVIGPDGEHVGHREMPYGWHVEHKFWTNDCGNGTDCESRYRSGPAYNPPVKRLAPGETWSPTPSMIAPVRVLRRDGTDPMGDMGDMRALPWFVEDRLAKDPKKLEQERREWKELAESRGFLYGDPGFRPKDKKPPLELYKSYRVLDTYSFNNPGPYRMRFLFAPNVWFRLPPGTLKQMEERLRCLWTRWPEACKQTVGRLTALIKGPYYALDAELRSWGWPEGTRVFHFESNWVEFEVIPTPFPEHMFKPRPGETAKDRALRKYLREQLLESSLWLEDTPEERERKLRKFREAKEKLKHKEALIGAAGEEIRQEKRQEKQPKPSPGTSEKPEKAMAIEEALEAVEKMPE